MVRARKENLTELLEYWEDDPEYDFYNVDVYFTSDEDVAEDPLFEMCYMATVKEMPSFENIEKPAVFAIVSNKIISTSKDALEELGLKALKSSLCFVDTVALAKLVENENKEEEIA